MIPPKTSAVTDIALRDVWEHDLPTFFEHQQDPAAVHMAAFTAEDPADREAFSAHWEKILADDTVTTRTVLLDGNVVGHVASFQLFGVPEVTYWMAKEHWGKGLATAALALFLLELKTRPLYARAARDNAASLRVLERCGFAVTDYETAFANARGEEIEEAILELDEGTFERTVR